MKLMELGSGGIWTCHVGVALSLKGRKSVMTQILNLCDMEKGNDIIKNRKRSWVRKDFRYSQLSNL